MANQEQAKLERPQDDSAFWGLSRWVSNEATD